MDVVEVKEEIVTSEEEEEMDEDVSQLSDPDPDPDPPDPEKAPDVSDVHTCPLCDKGFAKKSSLASHLVTHFNGVTASPQKDTPNEDASPKKSPRKNASPKKKQSTKRSKSKSKYKCTYCNTNFKTVQLLTKHLKRNKPGKSLMCPECKKKFARKCQWNAHIKQSKLNPPKTCEVCPEQFSWACLLSKHILIHPRTERIKRKPVKYEFPSLPIKNEISLPIKIVKSRNGTDKIADPDGFLYEYKNKTSDLRTTWKCEKRRHLVPCNACVYTIDDRIVAKYLSHNHPVEVGKDDSYGVRHQIKERCLSSDDPLEFIIEEEYKDLPEHVLTHLPSKPIMKKAMRNYRRKNGHDVKPCPRRAPAPPLLTPEKDSGKIVKKFIENEISKKMLADQELTSTMTSYDPFPVTYIKGRGGKVRLVDTQGHVYISQDQDQAEVLWSCEQHRYCTATARTLNDQIIEMNSVHSHSSDIGRMLVLNAVRRMKQFALLTDKSIEGIVASEIETYVKEFLSLLPDKDTLQKILYGVREKRQRTKLAAQMEKGGMEPVPAKFFPGNNNNVVLMDDGGYTYNIKQRPGVTAKTRWRCTQKPCRANVHTLDGNIISVNGEHDHPPLEDNKADVKILLRKMKDRALASDEPLRVIIESEKAQASPETVARLAPTDHLYKILKRSRQSGVPRLYQKQMETFVKQSSAALNPDGEEESPPGGEQVSQVLNGENQQIIFSQDLMGEGLDNNTIIYIVEQAAINGADEVTIEHTGPVNEASASAPNHEPVIEGHERAEFISNATQNPYLEDACGYLYVYHRVRKEKTFWNCELSGTCSAKACTVGGTIVSASNDHNHPSAPYRIAMLKAVARMKHRALNTEEPLDVIIFTETDHHSDQVKELLPSRDKTMKDLEAIRERVAHQVTKKMGSAKKKRKWDQAFLQNIDPTSIVLSLHMPEEEPEDFTNINNQLREMLPIPGKLVPSNKSRSILVDPVGFTYSIKRVVKKTNRKQWRCSSKYCKARVKTVGKEIVELCVDHNHANNTSSSITRDILSHIREKVTNSDRPEEEIVDDELKLFSREVLEMLPKRGNIVKRMKKSRRDAQEVLKEERECNLAVRQVKHAAKLVTGQTGVKKLADPDGYLYYLKREHGDALEWICDRQSKCQARAETEGEQIVRLIGYHSHAADVGRCEALATLDEMKERVVSEVEVEIEDIISSEKAKMTADGVAWLPCPDLLLSSLHKLRQSGAGGAGGGGDDWSDSDMDEQVPTNNNNNDDDVVMSETVRAVASMAMSETARAVASVAMSETVRTTATAPMSETVRVAATLPMSETETVRAVASVAMNESTG